MLTLFASPLAWLRGLNPLVPTGIAAAFAIGFAVQTVRIEGLLIWPIHINGLKADLSDANSTITAMQDASKAELARANAAVAAHVQHEKELNDAADQRIADARADDARRLDAYLGRLRASLGRGDSPALPAATGKDVAQGGNGAGATPVMDALNDDLAICTTNSRRLLEIHNEAVSDTAGEH